MTSKSELKRFVAQGKPGARAEELAISVCLDGREPRAAVLSVLITYGEEVRKRAARKCNSFGFEIVRQSGSEDYGVIADSCATAVQEMGLP